MLVRFTLVCTAAVAALAQTPPPAPAAKPPPAAPSKPEVPRGTLDLTVVEKGSKLPIERAQVTIVAPNGTQSGFTTDADGKIKAALLPGSNRLTVRRAGQSGYVGVPAVKVVSIRVNEDTKAEIETSRPGEISGRVLDSRGMPVQGARVTLLMRTYEFWSPNIVYLNTPISAQTNDLGEYTLPELPIDVPFHVFAEIVTPGTVETLASSSADPALRRPILAGTFYPSAADPSAGQAITLSEGQRRENVDVRMIQTKSFCVEGKLLSAPPGDVPHTISVDLTSIVSGVFNGYGSFRNGRSVSLDREGKARVCGLWPGSYRFTVQPQSRGRGQQEYYGGGEFIITDKDLSSLAAKVGPTFDWPGEIIVNGAVPPGELKMVVALGNVTPTSISTSLQSEIPGKFTFKSLHYDRELLQLISMPNGWYVESAMYGTDDLTLLNGRFTLDKPDTPLKVVVSPKGSRIKVKVTDEKGQPAPGGRISLVPRRLTAAQQLVGRLWSCYSDENGECAVFTPINEAPRPVLAPGEYIVLAAEIPFNQSADVLEQVWRTLQSQGTKVTLQPGATGEVSIKRVTLQ